MQTRVCRLYAQGDIRVETETVAAPGPGEVLVALGAGGICGSDLHYFREGGFGPIRVREPIILGHEAAGTVLENGPGVDGLVPGDRVALNPSRPCGRCSYCREGLTTHCLDMRFSGSAMRFPHQQGMFRDLIVVEAGQCLPVGGTAFAEAACAEPLAVCLHAASRAGDIAGRRVLVTGAGPIGALSVAVAAAAGAAEVVATDLDDQPLAIAARMGATRTINVARDAAQLEAFGADKGHFHVVFECSAAAPAIRAAVAAIRPQGRFVQVGIAGDTPVPLSTIVGKEIEIHGTQRFRQTEFRDAVDAIVGRRIDVRPVVTHTLPLKEAEAAFRIAGDRSRATKVHLAFG